MEKRPILIMTSMKVEAEFLLQKLKNKVCEKVGKYSFYEGTIENYPVVVCHCHIHSVNSAVATYVGIEKYSPIAIISQGTAGAHGKNIHIGDIVIGEKCVNIVCSRTPRKKEGEGSNSLEWDLVNFIEGEDNRLIYQYGDNHLIELAKKVNYTDGKIHFGTYGTLCEEMEGIAVYSIANDFEIPVLGIRVISNNEILEEPYDRNTALKSQEFTYKLILEIVKEE